MPVPLKTMGSVMPTVIPRPDRIAPVRAAPIRTTNIPYRTLATPQPIANRLEISSGFQPTCAYAWKALGQPTKTIDQGTIISPASIPTNQ